MFLLGGLLGGIAKGIASKAAGGGVLGGLLQRRLQAGRSGGGGMSGGTSVSGGPAPGGASQANTRTGANEDGSISLTRQDGQPVVSAPPETKSVVAEQADTMQEVNKTASAPRALDPLLDDRKAEVKPEQTMPSSPVAAPEAFANKGEGTAPTAKAPEEEFGAQPVPQPQEMALDTLFDDPPGISVEQRSGFDNKPLVFDQAAFPSAPVGAPPMAPASNYSPQFRSRRA